MNEALEAVEIRDVTKRFGAQTAVDALSLAVPQGAIYGFIGPNGSGKTTTLRMIMRILHPDAGVVRVLGSDALGAVDDRVAYLPEERGLYKQMTVSDVLEYYAALKGMRRADARRETARWLERLGLAAHAHKRIAALSKGMSQKVQFIATVIARPTLVLLDEPFSGLDPVNAVVLREAILDLRKTATVIFSTHDMTAAEELCDFIFMIHRGRKVLDGTLEQIKSAYGSDTLRVRLERPVDLRDLRGVSEITNLGNVQELRLGVGAEPDEILAELMRRGSVRHFEVAHPSLHEIFVRIARPESDGERAEHAERAGDAGT
jgi:ABC-2 type transport system ATP-binding protein